MRRETGRDADIIIGNRKGTFWGVSRLLDGMDLKCIGEQIAAEAWGYAPNSYETFNKIGDRLNGK